MNPAITAKLWGYVITYRDSSPPRIGLGLKSFRDAVAEIRADASEEHFLGVSIFSYGATVNEPSQDGGKGS